MKTIDFKTFETEVEPQKNELFIYGGGLLRKSPTVKKWNKIGIGKSQVNELGVWAIDNFIDNEIVEVCPVILFDKKDIEGNAMLDYVFKIDDNQYAFALGAGTLYAHRNQSNVRWNYDPVKKSIIFRTSRPIKQGEELFISYGKDYFKSRNTSMKGEVNRTKTSDQ